MSDNSKVERLLAEGVKLDIKEENFAPEIFKSGRSLVVIGPTWYLNPKKTFESFKESFSKDFYQAAADYGARPLSHIRRFISSPEFLRAQAIRRPHPENIDGTFLPWFNGGGKIFVLGIDLSNLAHDNAAFTLAHLENDKAYVDLFHVIPGGRGEHLVFAEVRNFIASLQKRNFYIAHASIDSWQSYSLAQDLESLGIKTEINSTDRSTELPDSALGMLMNGRVDFYYYPLFIKEACELIKTKAGKIDHPSNGCFTADTRICLLNGANVSFRYLCENYSDGKEFQVWSYGPKGPVIGHAHSPRLTKKDTPVIEVTFDNFQKVKCTPDHRFMLKNGQYKQAKDLEVSESLMSIYPGKCKVHRIVDAGKADVYDVTVNEFSNFALMAGPFVHNSKDVWDSFCHSMHLIKKYPSANLSIGSA